MVNEGMPAEMSDANPYSRVVAHNNMGVIKDIQQLRERTVMIVGLGGLGRYKVSLTFAYLKFVLDVLRLIILIRVVIGNGTERL